MNTHKIRKYLSISLLLSSMAIIPGCELLDKLKKMFKSEKEEESKEKKVVENNGNSEQSAVEGEVLMSVNGKPLITQSKFEEFWNMYAESNPNISYIVQIYPNIRQEIFEKVLVPFELAKLYAEKAGLLNSQDFKKKLKRQIDTFEKSLALEYLKEDALKHLDKSDAEIEKFYNEKKTTLPIFQRPPFIKTQASSDGLMVEFANEQDANNFLEKVQKPGADFKAIAKEEKKDVKDLKNITMESKDIEPVVAVRLNELKVGEVTKTSAGKEKYFVIKSTAKQEAKYAPYSEFKDKPEIKTAIEQAMLQAKGPELINNKIEELKKQYNVKEDLSFFEKEKLARQAELEERLKEFQKNQENEESKTKTENKKESKK